MMQKYQRYFRWMWVLGCFALLAACGQKGDLYLPDSQAGVVEQVQQQYG